MAKYIVEVKDGETLYKAVIAPDGEPYITPAMGNVYTEPDLEQVRKEAYKEGREAGIKDGKCEAWEAARRIIHMPEGDLLNIFTECYSAVCTALQVLLKYDASEVIEKLKAYEQKQEKVQVGDEVIAASGKAVVIGVGPVHFEYVYADGSTEFDKVENVKKTGRHFPEIAEVLEKMRGE